MVCGGKRIHIKIRLFKATMHSNITVITALYDINRENEGDGRRIDEYFEWLQKTLSLNTRFVIFIQDLLLPRLESILKCIKNEYVTVFATKLEDIPYYKYKQSMDYILSSESYKTKITAPTRIECKLSLYNIIQYSKLEWLNQIIHKNPYNSEYFFWMDAGCSRFFENVDINISWPNEKKLLSNKIVIQGRNDLYSYNNWDNLHLDAVNLLCGTCFGGHKDNITWLASKIQDIFEHLLSINIVNNEQIALALIWKKHPEKFDVYINANQSTHLPLFNYLSLV
jgi:hypothetical protein